MTLKSETPPAAAEAAEGREGVHGEADHTNCYSASEPETCDGRRNGDTAFSSDRLLEEHFVHAPAVLRDRFNRFFRPPSCDPANALAQLARVRFQRSNFEFDTDGCWSVLLPVYDGRRRVDWAAFAVDGPDTRRAYFRAFGVGFESALWDMGFHPQRRLLVHFDPWSYMAAGFTGFLPVDWRRTGIELLERRVTGIVYPDGKQAQLAHACLRSVLKVPPSFVKAAMAA